MSNRRETIEKLKRYDAKGVGQHLVAESIENDEFGEEEMGSRVCKVGDGARRVAGWLLTSRDEDEDVDPDLVGEPDPNSDVAKLADQATSSSELDQMDIKFADVMYVDNSVIETAKEICGSISRNVVNYKVEIPSGFESNFKKFMNWINQTSKSNYKVVQLEGSEYVVVHGPRKTNLEVKEQVVATPVEQENEEIGDEAFLDIDNMSGSTIPSAASAMTKAHQEIKTSQSISLLSRLSEGVKIKKRGTKGGSIKYTLKNIGLGEKEIVKIISKNIDMSIRELMIRIFKKTGNYPLVSRTYDLDTIK